MGDYHLYLRLTMGRNIYAVFGDRGACGPRPAWARVAGARGPPPPRIRIKCHRDLFHAPAVSPFVPLRHYCRVARSDKTHKPKVTTDAARHTPTDRPGCSAGSRCASTHGWVRPTSGLKISSPRAYLFRQGALARDTSRDSCVPPVHSRRYSSQPALATAAPAVGITPGRAAWRAPPLGRVRA